MEKKFLGIDFLKNKDITLETSTVHTYPEYCHFYNEFILYEPFDGYITIDNKKFTVDKPLAILVTPTHFHSITVSSGVNSTYYKIGFLNSNLHSRITNELTSSIVYSEVDSFFKSLVKKTFCQTNKKYVNNYIKVILSELLARGTFIDVLSNTIKNDLIANVLEYLNQNFTEDITLNSVAEHFKITPQYLSSAFKKNTSITFIKQLTDMRLKYAASLLIDEDMNVTEACYNCGYNNLANFMRAFKKHYGVSPKIFKNNNFRSALI